MGSDDLAKVIGGGTRQPSPFGQGTLVEFDPATFVNRVVFRGGQLTNLPILPGVDALSLAAGDNVVLVRVEGDGVATWSILGRIDVPPLAEPVAIKGGDLIVQDGGTVVVRDANGDLIGTLGIGSDGRAGIQIFTAAGDRLIRLGELDFAPTGAPTEGIELLEDGRIQFLAPNGNSVGTIGPLYSAGSIAFRGYFLEDSNGNDIFSTTTQNPDGSGGGRFRIGDPAQGAQLFAQITAQDLGLFLNAQDSAVNINSLGTGAQIILNSASNQVFTSYANTGSAANCFLAVNGQIMRNASSRRYKQDIRDFHVQPHTVLDLKSRTWRDRQDVESDPASERWHVGLIAEEVDEAGLGAFVDYNSDGEPQSVTYDRLCVALLDVVKAQQRQLDDLTAWARTQGFAPAPADTHETTQLPKRVDVANQPHRPADLGEG